MSTFDIVDELISYIENLKDETKWIMYEKAGSVKFSDVTACAKAQGAIKAFEQIINKIEELFNNDDTDSKLDDLCTYINKKRNEAIMSQQTCIKTRNYDGLSRMNEVENTCDDILYEIERINKEYCNK